MGRLKSFGTFRSSIKYKNGLKAGSSITIAQAFHILRRLVTIAAALYYVYLSIDAVISTMTFATAQARAPHESQIVLPSFILQAFTGNGPIRSSPLFGILRNSTMPRNDTLYLGFAGPGFQPCETSNGGPTAYSNAFVRQIYDTLVRDTAFNSTFLKSHELILPVVDCTFVLIMAGVNTVLRTFYLMRSTTNPDEVLFMSVTFSTQDYSIPAQKQSGHIGLADISVMSDMSQRQLENYCAISKGYPYDEFAFKPCVRKGVTVDHHLIIHTVPEFPELEASKEILISNRGGMFVGTEYVQSNILYDHSLVSTTPDEVISVWVLSGGAVYHDTWAWVHFIHLYFAADTLFSMLVLFLVIYQNFHAESIWIGDAFTSISNSLTYRGLIILLTWAINRFWTLFEYAVNYADITNDSARSLDLRSIHADLLTIYLSLASILGILLRERIDPALVVIAFEVGFQGRFIIMTHFPTTIQFLKDFAHDDTEMGMQQVHTSVSSRSPMGAWTAHEAEAKDIKVISATIMPIFLPMLTIVQYAILRKIYRHFRPEKIRVLKVTSYSDKNDTLSALKSSYTMFEIATGAALQVRYGVVSDNENYLFIKGLKYASADGIYCSGYVIANGKFLIATEDLMAIILMKLTHLRFAKIYVHDVHEHTVHQTARLLYPSMISWADLYRINISVLS